MGPRILKELEITNNSPNGTLALRKQELKLLKIYIKKFILKLEKIPLKQREFLLMLNMSETPRTNLWLLLDLRNSKEIIKLPENKEELMYKRKLKNSSKRENKLILV